MHDTIEQSPDEHERKDVVLTGVHEFEQAALDEFRGFPSAVDRVNAHGREEGGGEEEGEAEPIL